MHVPSRSNLAKILGISIALMLVLLVSLQYWIIPAIIVSQIQAKLEGNVTIRGWWINGKSAGVRGLTIHEGPRHDSPVWLTVEKVAADVTLGGILQGRVSPSRVDVTGPRVTFRVDREGHFLNLPKVKGGGGSSGSLPKIVTTGARVTFRREGRPLDMVVSGVQATLIPDAKSEAFQLTGEARDPYWGNWNTAGTIGLATTRGEIRFTGQHIVTDPEKLARVHFVPTDVWSHAVPSGPVDLSVGLVWESEPAVTLHTHTKVKFLETEAHFPSFDLVTTQTTGTLRVDDAIVTLDQVRGQSLGGQVAANGTLDFSGPVPRIAIDVDLAKVDVVKTPKSWQLSEAAITGLLTGKVLLRALLEPTHVDLSGSSGQAIVENGTIQGIPVKSLRLAMHAQGSDLQYDTKSPDSASHRRTVPHGRTRMRLSHPGGASKPRVIPIAFASEAVDPAPPSSPKENPSSKPAEPEAKGGFHLPKSITTQIELEDVDIHQLLVKAQYFTGVPLPLPISGKFSLKADATIPLGALKNIKAYSFHGDLTLNAASIAKTDFGRLMARVDLADGVLELKKLRGLLVDRPDGGPDNPPAASTVDIPIQGPLPPGGFRCDLRAEVEPLGRLTGKLEGVQLPLGEIVAPVLPRPTPVGGLVSLQLDAATSLRDVTEPKAWTVSGHAESSHLTYTNAALDSVNFDFGLKDAHLSIPRIEARLDKHPLNGKLELGIAEPYPFTGALDVVGWDLSKLGGLIPGIPHPSPASGILTVHAEAKGTAQPRKLETDGRGQVVNLQVGTVPLATVPFYWKTENDVIKISGVEARPFGGHVVAEAQVPILPGKPIEGSASIKSVDMSKLSVAIPGRDFKMSGKADGQAIFRIPSDWRLLEAKARLASPELTLQKFAVEQINALLHAQNGVVNYELTADTLGGKVKFFGEVPLETPPGATKTSPAATGELRFVGFTLDHVWKALGTTGTVGHLSGRGALDVNLRDEIAGKDKGLSARGVIEFRDLNWGSKLPLGQLRATLDKSPAAWRIDPVSGNILGGTASGSAWGTTPASEPATAGFRFRVDRAALRQMAARWPDISRNITGLATIRLAGGLDKTFSATGDIQLTDARLAGFPISDLRLPLEFGYAPEMGVGALHIRQGSVRVAGGQFRGEASFRVGRDRSFQTQISLNNVDLQTLTRLSSDSSRGTSGQINGRITLTGPDPAVTQRLRGKVDLDLDDASLVSVPVFREIDRFLGAARGGLFEDGDLSGTIANRQLIVESFTLQGRLVQLHATGTVDFDTQMNLEVLVNTNQIIPETGQALVGLIPGLRDLRGRRDQATLQVANYLSNRLLKLRVTGPLKNPSVVLDSSIPVANAAVGFFSGVLKLPLGFVK